MRIAIPAPRDPTGAGPRGRPDRPVALRLDDGPLAGAPARGEAAPRPELPRLGVAAVAPSPEPAATPADTPTVTVARGDSLYVIFKRLGLPQSDLVKLLRTGKHATFLKRLKPGQTLEFRQGPDGAVGELRVARNALQSVRFVRGDDGFSSKLEEAVLETRRSSAFGFIESSLFVAGQKAGLSDRMIMQLAEIFGWDVDFALDIRAGDRFSVVYEELYNGDEKVRNGAILAAEFVNRGRTIQAIRYAAGDGQPDRYYSPNGESMRKAFLRTPVRFSRISSRFSRARRHPVLHTVRAHRGVDYAAPSGTPVRATGDGKISYVGRHGGYGRTVIIRHGGIYETVYAHMSRFAKRARTGRHVTQGQIIGYVGRSGLATGPHLHYEFRVRGVHRNPLTVRFPKAAPIEAAYRADFIARAKPLLAQLELLSRTKLASNLR